MFRDACQIHFRVTKRERLPERNITVAGACQFQCFLFDLLKFHSFPFRSFGLIISAAVTSRLFQYYGLPTIFFQKNPANCLKKRRIYSHILILDELPTTKRLL